jgi:hypothetical protein
MPTWPVPDGKRCITIELATEQVEHLDQQAQFLGCSRAAYLRQVILRDMGRIAPARRQAKATA